MSRAVDDRKCSSDPTTVIGENEVLGFMDRERWQRNLTTYAAYGMVERAPKLDDVIDERFVP